MIRLNALHNLYNFVNMSVAFDIYLIQHLLSGLFTTNHALIRYRKNPNIKLCK